jgi:hypothetical protein
MKFEQTLRERLGREAGAVDLPPRHPDRAVARARARHRHRRAAAAAGTAVVVTAAAAIAVPIVRKDGSHSTDRAVTPAAHGVLPTGPLDLNWSTPSTAPSVWELNDAFQGDDGAVYALATAPGVRFGDDDPDGHYLRALYKLNDDGTWQVTNLDGGRPDVSDASSAGGLLYAVSTAPGSSGNGEVPRLSVSSDGGDTWTTHDITPVESPSDQDVWDRDVAMSIESTGSQTLAMVTTDFTVDGKAVFPELNDQSAPYSIREGADGVSLIHYDMPAEVGVFSAVPPTSVPDESATTTVPGPALPERARPMETVVRTVPWSELGVSGQDAVASRRQFFLRAGDGWQPVARDMEGVGPVKLGVVGDRFYLAGDATKVGGDEGPGLVYTSADGESWTSAEIPGTSFVNAMGDALVAASYQGGIEVSLDYGSAWQDVDASASGMTPGVQVSQISGGPLGLALVVQNSPTEPIQLITTADLVNWNHVAVSDISGIADVAWATAFVGSDRIVVSAIGHGGPGNDPPAPQATVIGIPARG